MATFRRAIGHKAQDQTRGGFQQNTSTQNRATLTKVNEARSTLGMQFLKILLRRLEDPRMQCKMLQKNLPILQMYEITSLTEVGRKCTDLNNCRNE